MEKYLADRGVRSTANRLLVLKALMQAKGPVNLGDLEAELAPMDRASLFRTLTLFAKAELVHAFEDGSGSVKYELCHGHDHHTPDDMHAHFHCEHCGATYCLETVAAPMVDLPDGFRVQSVNYLLKGLCPRCSGQKAGSCC